MDRDPDELRRRLGTWLAARMGAAADVRLSELRKPGAGAANDTYLCAMDWREPSGARGSRGLVVRMQPHENQFLDPDVMFQARVLEALAGRSELPVPRVLWKEPGPEPLGAAFYVMEEVEGRILAEVPSYHTAGWAVDLATSDRAKLYDSTLQALAGLHRIDVNDDFEFLRRPGPGTSLERHLAWLQRWHSWAARGRSLDIVDDGLSWVLANRPHNNTEHLVWGDTRPGNMIFADDLSVAAVIDWEGAATGPAEVDLGWWLMFEEWLTAGSGHARMAGLPEREATIRRYEELLGSPTHEVEYYEILAMLQFAIIIVRFVDLQVDAGNLPADTTMRSSTPVTQMLARAIGIPEPDVSPDYLAGSSDRDG